MCAAHFFAFGQYDRLVEEGKENVLRGIEQKVNNSHIYAIEGREVIDMGYNSKKTSQKMASMAGKTLANPNASKTQKSLAASALAQSRTGKQTGAKMEDRASRVVRSRGRYATATRQLAGTVLSQSNKKR